MIRKQLEKRIIGTKMPGLLASMYDKAARMVIDSYYIPTAEEVIALLSQIKTGSLETDRRILDLGTGPGYLLIEIHHLQKQADKNEGTDEKTQRLECQRISQDGCNDDGDIPPSKGLLGISRLVPFHSCIFQAIGLPQSTKAPP